jgi:signal transduction histidine kinase
VLAIEIEATESSWGMNKSVMMTDHAEGSTGVGVTRTRSRWNLESHGTRSPILRYGLSVVCVAIALGLALSLEHYGFQNVESPLFDLAIVVTAWFAGVGPSVLAVVLSIACFTYFFTEPLYPFEISSGDLPYAFLFVAWAVIVAGFVTVRRRIEEDLRHTRDRLQIELEQRKQREHQISKLNQELVRQAAELEASNKELESFAYSVSHDLRAPLRHAVGFSELLQKQASSLLDDKSRRYIQTILESSKRMGNLIDDLRAHTQQATVDLDQLAMGGVQELRQETAGRDIAWKIGVLPVSYGDRSMLRLAIVNLVSNAVKFTRTRRPAEIEIGSVDGNRNEVEVFVKDNGAGFDMQYVNKLFGVFQRLHLSEEFEGTGIGLATVQRIIHRHGGKVRAEGAVDQGATFYFSLPKTQDAAERTANAP